MTFRGLAGALLGFPLAAVVLSLLLHVLPAGGNGYVIPALILFFPLWIAFMTGAFALRSGARAWITLGCANALGFFALWLTRHAAGL
jgi:hypothetical protein